MEQRFQNRTEAGRFLVEKLLKYSRHPEAMVLALPRGGVPIGFEVAMRLNLPLKIFVVRKLGVPGHEEFAMGAIASGGISFVDKDIVQQLGISQTQVQEVQARESQELTRRAQKYGEEVSTDDIHGKIIILVDDGLATGATMRAACAALKPQLPRRLVVAVPVASASTSIDLLAEADELVCVETPQDFRAVGQWYEDFSQTSDEEVSEFLERSKILSRDSFAGTQFHMRN